MTSEREYWVQILEMYALLSIAERGGSSDRLAGCRGTHHRLDDRLATRQKG